jgi:very-short-patch-repair endonuclease
LAALFAWWLDLTKFAPDDVEVTVPRVSNHPRRPGVRIRRRDLRPTDVIERGGLRVTAMPLTVIEAAVRRGGGAKLMDSALQRHTDLRALWAAQLGNTGRHGSPAARRLLQAAEDGARSAAERLLIELLKAAGITGWKANYRVAGYAVDVGFPAFKVALEADGLAFHSDSADCHNDRVRQNVVILAGWQVLRFTLDRPHRVSRSRHCDRPQRDLGTLSGGQRNHGCTNRPWGTDRGGAEPREPPRRLDG